MEKIQYIHHNIRNSLGWFRTGTSIHQMYQTDVYT